jgi:hypothetical protein
MADAPDDAIDGLYGLPIDEFVGARDALAKELRADGRRDDAAAVKALKKPSVAAWAVNQALRTQGKAARELWKAGDALAAAQEKVLAGKGSGADLRTAGERERAAVESLVDAARGLLTASGGDLTAATIERVRQTLHAGAIDPEARDEIASGRATRERAPQGLFGGGEAVAPPAPPASKRERKAKPKRDASAAKPKRDASAAKGKRDSAAAKRAREEAARERKEAAARERKEAAARERARKAAQQRVAKTEKALAAAEKRSAEAAERLEAARGDERAAADALAEARSELRAAERG